MDEAEKTLIHHVVMLVYLVFNVCEWTCHLVKLQHAMMMNECRSLQGNGLIGYLPVEIGALEKLQLLYSSPSRLPIIYRSHLLSNTDFIFSASASIGGRYPS
jgi:hypothetical protein